jgi:hypothetical protein
MAPRPASRGEVTSQTPLPTLHAGEDRKFLSTTGTSTDPLSAGGRGQAAWVGAEHSGWVLLALSDLRAAGQLVDLVLVDSQGERASAHRAVVAGTFSGVLSPARSERLCPDAECVRAG